VSASIGARTRATENHLGRNVRVRFWQLSYRCLLQRLPRPRPAESSLVAGDRDGLCKLCHSSGHDAAGLMGSNLVRLMAGVFLLTDQFGFRPQ
jgi:hypothetical protein